MPDRTRLSVTFHVHQQPLMPHQDLRWPSWGDSPSVRCCPQGDALFESMTALRSVPDNHSSRVTTDLVSENTWCYVPLPDSQRDNRYYQRIPDATIANWDYNSIKSIISPSRTNSRFYYQSTNHISCNVRQLYCGPGFKSHLYHFYDPKFGLFSNIKPVAIWFRFTFHLFLLWTFHWT